MKQADFTAQFPVVWASGAEDEYVQYPIPETDGGDGRASLALGFPPETMKPLGAGGKYAYGQDVNGGLRMTSTSSQNYEAGVIAPWSASFAQSIGGYPKGARVADPSVSGKIWLSSADDNMTTPGASGATWVDFFAPVSPGRLLNVVSFSSSSTYVPTQGTGFIVVEMVGGGGGGGGASPTGDSTRFSAATGGQGGSYVRFLLSSGFAGAVLTVGSAGTGGSSGQNGASGGATQFGNSFRVRGGSGGAAGRSLAAPAAGGSTIANGQSSLVSGALLSSVGGSPGGWVSISPSVGLVSVGGDSQFGRGGNMGPGNDGAASGVGGASGPGAGGAGAWLPADYTQGLSGAPGGQGLIVIYEYSA